MVTKTLWDAMAEFELSCRADGLSENTIIWYLSLLRGFMMSFDDDKSVASITVTDCRAYIAGLRDASERYVDAPQRPTVDGGYSNDTIKGHVAALHRFFGWCSEEYDIDNPMHRIRRPKRRKPQPRAIERDDFVRLFAIASTRDQAMLSVMADTGVRHGGLLSMTVSGTDIAKRRATVTEKGMKQHTIYLSYLVTQLVEKWLHERDSGTDALWTSYNDGRPLTQSGVHEMLKRLKKRAGVRGRVNPHSFRHGFAREYIKGGGDISTLARLLGHADIQTTHVYYAIFSEDELQQMHDKYGGVDAWLDED